MKNPDYRSKPLRFRHTRESGIQAIWAETNLDSRVRGNDESREKNVPRETPPFSFIVGVHKLMTHFVVSP
jgi:hypothetical protein